MIEMLVTAIALAQSIFTCDTRPTWSQAFYLLLLLAIFKNALTDLGAKNVFFVNHIYVSHHEENTF